MADEKDTTVEAEVTTEAAAEEVVEVAAKEEKPAKAKAEKKPYVRIEPRLQKRYRAEIKAELMKEFGFKNVHGIDCYHRSEAKDQLGNQVHRTVQAS